METVKRATSTVNRHAERELTITAVKTAIEYARTNNGRALIDMGFQSEDIEALKQMSVSDMLELCDQNTRFTFVNISVDRTVFARMLDLVDLRRQDRCLLEDLMRHGASFHVLNSLRGIGQAEYAAMNLALGEPAKPGRPPRCSEQDTVAVWQLWHSDSMRNLSLAHKLLEASQTTSVPVATIWMLLQQWYTDGVLAAGNDRELDAVMRQRSPNISTL